jgi:hypothetical protein
MKPRFKSRFCANSGVYFSVNINKDFLRGGGGGGRSVRSRFQYETYLIVCPPQESDRGEGGGAVETESRKLH